MFTSSILKDSVFLGYSNKDLITLVKSFCPNIPLYSSLPAFLINEGFLLETYSCKHGIGRGGEMGTDFSILESPFLTAKWVYLIAVMLYGKIKFDFGDKPRDVFLKVCKNSGLRRSDSMLIADFHFGNGLNHTKPYPGTDSSILASNLHSMANIYSYINKDGFLEFENLPVSDPLSIELAEWDSQDWVPYSKGRVKYLGGACGVGKTIFGPQHIKRPGKQLVILIPRISAVQNAVSFFKGQGLKVFSRADGIEVAHPLGTTQKTCDLLIYTTGAFVAQFKNLDLHASKADVFMDEYHDSEPAIPMATFMLLESGFDVTLVSATPMTKTFSSAKKHVVTTVCVPEYVKDIKHTYISSKTLDFINLEVSKSKTVAFVCPRLKHIDSLLNDLRLSGDSRLVISRKACSFNGVTFPFDLKLVLDKVALCQKKGSQLVIVATSILEVGVTIPNLDLVVDLGIGLTPEPMVKEFFDAGGNCAASSVLVDTKAPRLWSSVFQVLGRVGRTGPGRAIVLNCDSIYKTPIPSTSSTIKLWSCFQTYSCSLPPKLVSSIPWCIHASVNSLSTFRKANARFKADTELVDSVIDIFDTYLRLKKPLRTWTTVTLWGLFPNFFT